MDVQHFTLDETQLPTRRRRRHSRGEVKLWQTEPTKEVNVLRYSKPCLTKSSDGIFTFNPAGRQHNGPNHPKPLHRGSKPKRFRLGAVKPKKSRGGKKALGQYRQGYFCPPNSTSAWDVFAVLAYHMLPFTGLPMLFAMLGLWYSQRQFGAAGPAALVAIGVFLVMLPTFYNRRFRKIYRPFYMACAAYVPSCRWVAPSKPFPPGRPLIFACHPHGRMFFSQTMLWQVYDIPLKGILTEGDVFVAAAGGFFLVPVLRHIFATLGIVSASKHVLVKKLREKNHVTIAVGGLKEVLLGTNKTTDRLYLRKRKGFVKLAIEEKAGLVPIYYFNENQLFRHDPPWLLRFWAKVNKYASIGVPFMRGVGNLTIPYRRDLLVAIGDPVFPEEGETVDELHGRYIAALKDLFDRFVGQSPDKKHKLEIF